MLLKDKAEVILQNYKFNALSLEEAFVELLEAISEASNDEGCGCNGGCTCHTMVGG